MSDIYESLKDKIREVDLVLIGMGEEMEENFSEIAEKLKSQQLLEKEYAKYEYLQNSSSQTYAKAYQKLFEIVKDKNYFIVSLAKDDYIYQSDFEQERIVTPCGGYRFMQCSKGCNEDLYHVDDDTNHIKDIIKENKDVKELVCPKCGAPLCFNNIYAEKYLEKGYLQQWEKYTKWLQGTINKKVCMIELGAGLVFPSIVRWPFEKIAFYNNKAVFFRIHKTMSALPKEICEKGFSVEEDALTFLLQM